MQRNLEAATQIAQDPQVVAMDTKAPTPTAASAPEPTAAAVAAAAPRPTPALPPRLLSFRSNTSEVSGDILYLCVCVCTLAVMHARVLCVHAFSSMNRNARAHDLSDRTLHGEQLRRLHVARLCLRPQDGVSHITVCPYM